LEPALLKFHVENAILIRGRARNVSEEDSKKREEQIGTFVQSYKQAQKVHQIRLELEAKGHPDHQSKEPYDLGQSIELESLDCQKSLLEGALQLWSDNLKRFTTDVPALLFLRDKLLLRAIQNIRSQEPNLVRLMPFIVLCLGTQMIHCRDQVYEVAGTVLQSLIDSRRALAGRSQHNFVCSAEEGLSQFAQLIRGVQDALEERGLVVRHDAEEADAQKVFLHKMISRDVVSSPVEKTYEVMISEYLSGGSLACPLSTQIVWGNKSTSIIEVKAWLQLARAPVNEDMCIVHSLYFVAVDQLSIPCRQVLLEGLLCQNDEWQKSLSVPVFLYFSSTKGLESFVQFPDSRGCVTDPQTFRQKFQNSLWGFHEPGPPVSRLIVVAGDSGSGKSHWCSAKGRHLTIPPEYWLHIVVHEGFCAQLLIDRYRAATEGDHPGRIGIHFDVSEYCDLELFGIVMHDLLATGLFVDSSTGDAQVLLSDVEHFIFVELPALEDKWPLPLDDTFHALQHPFLPHLPAIKFALTSDSCKTLSCKQNDEHHFMYPLFNDSKTSYVAQCLQLLSLDPSNVTFPSFEELPFENMDPEVPADVQRERTDGIIRDAFAKFGSQRSQFMSKRILCNFVSLLFERCVYLSQMQKYTSNFDPVTRYLYDDTFTEPFLAHFWVHSQEDILRLGQPVAPPPPLAPGPAPAVVQPAPAFTLKKGSPLPAPYPYIPGFYAKLLRYCVDEAAFLAGAHLPSDEPQVWVLRPCDDYSKVRLLVSLPKKGMRPQLNQIQLRTVKLEDFLGKRILIEMFSTAGKVEREERENIAPFFNLSSSSIFKQVIEQSQYVLTTEFLFKLFLLQGRRSCRSSLVFSGVRLIQNINP
jgi:hypothetical protein